MFWQHRSTRKPTFFMSSALHYLPAADAAQRREVEGETGNENESSQVLLLNQLRTNFHIMRSELISQEPYP